MTDRVSKLKLSASHFAQFSDMEIDNISIRNLSGSFTIVVYDNNSAQLIVHNVFDDEKFKQTLLEQFSVAQKKYTISFVKFCIAKSAIEKIPKDRYEDVVIDSNGTNIISLKVENLECIMALF
jgi:predicted lipase